MAVAGTVRIFEQGCIAPLTMCELVFETRGNRVIVRASRVTRAGATRAEREIGLDAASTWIEHVLGLVETRSAALAERPRPAISRSNPTSGPSLSPRLTFQALLKEPREITHQFPVDDPNGQTIREHIRISVDEIIDDR